MFGDILAQMAEDPDGPEISDARREELMAALAHPKAATEIQRGFALEAASVQEGQDGKIAYKGGMGPMFFQPEEWQARIERYLGD